MSNKHAPKYHGLDGVHGRRPKSPLYKRKNKAKARLLREERRKDKAWMRD